MICELALRRNCRERGLNPARSQLGKLALHIIPHQFLFQSRSLETSVLDIKHSIRNSEFNSLIQPRGDSTMEAAFPFSVVNSGASNLRSHQCADLPASPMTQRTLIHYKAPPPPDLQFCSSRPLRDTTRIGNLVCNMNPSNQQSHPPNEIGARTAPGSGSAQSSGGGGDMLDKGVDFLEQKSGHQQKPGTTEKV